MVMTITSDVFGVRNVVNRSCTESNDPNRLRDENRASHLLEANFLSVFRYEEDYACYD